MYFFLVGGLEEKAALCQEIALLEQIICNSSVFTEISAILTVACCTPGKESRRWLKAFLKHCHMIKEKWLNDLTFSIILY